MEEITHKFPEDPNQLYIFPKPEKIYYIAQSSGETIEEAIAQACVEVGWVGTVVVTSVGACTEYEVEESRNVNKVD